MENKTKENKMIFKLIVILWLSALTYYAGLPREVGELNMACFDLVDGKPVEVLCENP